MSPRRWSGEGFAIPLLIGGATTSRVHTAVKIHPRYVGGQTVYVTDASRAVGVVSKLCSPRRKSLCRDVGAQEHARLRRRTPSPRRRSMRLPLAQRPRQRRSARLVGATIPPRQPSSAPKSSMTTTSRSSARYIDWTPFFKTWELKGRYPRSSTTTSRGAAARQLLTTPRRCWPRSWEALVPPKAVIGFWPAGAVQDHIRLFADETRRERWRPSSPCASSSRSATGGRGWRCRISSRRSRAAGGILGAFVVTAGFEEERDRRRFERANDDYPPSW